MGHPEKALVDALKIHIERLFAMESDRLVRQA
jgi:hypothetical protein